MYLAIENLNIGRSTNKPLFVKPLSVVFESPGLILIVGRSGAGKTTFLLTLSQILPPLEGGIFEISSANNNIYEKNNEINKMKFPWIAEGRFNLAFQNPENLFFMTTVKEELEYSLIINNISALEIEKRCIQWLEFWGLDPNYFLHKNPFHLSGGEKRKIALASVTINTKELILLDEPLAGLDHKSTINITKCLVELAQKSLVIVVTHDIEPFLKYAKKIIVFKTIDDYENKFYSNSSSGSNFNSSPNFNCNSNYLYNNYNKILPICYNTYKDFILDCINDETIYPLPKWYITIIYKYNLLDNLPGISYSDIIDVINSKK